MAALLSTTFDQLRTFCTVCRLGNVRAAARAFGRDHSSVRKQLDTIEDRFQEAARGRLLVHATSRGGAVQVTEAGREVLTFAKLTLDALNGIWQNLDKARRDRPLRFGAAAFGAYVGEFFAETHEATARECERRGVRFTREVVPVPAMEKATQHGLLGRDDLDFTFEGALCLKTEAPVVDASLAFIEWLRDDIVVLANIELAAEALDSRLILEQRIPMVGPRKGIFHDIMVAGLDEGDRRHLNVLEWCNDPFVAIDLLHHRLCHAAVICTRTFARFATARAGAGHLRTVPYRCEWDYRFGLLARRADIEAWSPAHPARVTWELLTRLAAERRGADARA